MEQSAAPTHCPEVCPQWALSYCCCCCRRRCLEEKHRKHPISPGPSVRNREWWSQEVGKDSGKTRVALWRSEAAVVSACYVQTRRHNRSSGFEIVQGD